MFIKCAELFLGATPLLRTLTPPKAMFLRNLQNQKLNLLNPKKNRMNEVNLEMGTQVRWIDTRI